ncbi:MAG: ChaN family lipoprotein [Gammaproteobacteria bacterium]|nr:ChaN family lipoprotein [Gammaproteobacteria bacterium]
MKPMRNTLLAAIVATLPAAAWASQDSLHLKIGDPARSGHELPLVLDGIRDTARGDLVTPDEMARRLAGTGILFIGENHTNLDFHHVQFRSIRALHEAGREVMIGLEMFPYTEQAVLDNWVAGRYTEEGFLALGRWYDNWSYNWNYYRDIFLYARDHGLRMVALNSPRPAVNTVRSKGFDALSTEERAHLPPQIAPQTEAYETLFRSVFSKDDALHMKGPMLEGLYRAQTMWDATMGWNALQALKNQGGKDAIMVVMIGAGHVTYGLGAERQIDPYYDGRISSLVPVTVVDDEGKPVKQVRASYANFVWGLPEERDTVYPSLGVSLMGSFGKATGQIIQVSKDSVADRAGLKVGDILLSLDGTAIDSSNTLNRVFSSYRWGDSAKARISRGGVEQDIEVPIRRIRP